MSNNSAARRFSVAPMLDWTDRHCRYFLRQISQHALLYTEMVTTGAIIYGKGDFLGFNEAEHPVALQLGGSDPEAMAECAARAQAEGYDEVNINVGCPSDRVQNGAFGACLMANPEVVAACVKAMQGQVTIPVTVKSRIGIDDMDEYEDLTRFVNIVADAGCNTFVVHARKAWLKGLSPKENRDIPPLMYDRVYQLKQEFPDLHIGINGGINNHQDGLAHLQHVDEVMLGREVYANPYCLAEVDALYFSDDSHVTSRASVVKRMHEYTQGHVEQGGRVWHVARHMLGLFQGQPGGKVWRRYLSQNAVKGEVSPDVLLEALAMMEETKAKAIAFQAEKFGA